MLWQGAVEVPLVAWAVGLILVIMLGFDGVLQAVSHTTHLDGAVVVWVEAEPLACLPSFAPPLIAVAACTSRARFAEEEVEELVGDGQV
jgi:hypothetical protein